jgi:DNA-directed RNA polymerase I subunit RPA2
MSSPGSSSSAESSAGPSTPPASYDLLPSNGKLADWQQPNTFHTLQIQDRFENPSDTKFEHSELQSLVAPHIESFNALWSADPSVEPPAGSRNGAPFVGEGVGLLEKSIAKIPSRVVFDGTEESITQGNLGNRLSFRIESVSLGKPTSTDKGRSGLQSRIHPVECRERLMSYRARMTARISWSVNGLPKQYEERDMGLVPVMVKVSSP